MFSHFSPRHQRQILWRNSRYQACFTFLSWKCNRKLDASAENAALRCEKGGWRIKTSVYRMTDMIKNGAAWAKEKGWRIEEIRISSPRAQVILQLRRLRRYSIGSFQTLYSFYRKGAFSLEPGLCTGCWGCWFNSLACVLAQSLNKNTDSGTNLCLYYLHINMLCYIIAVFLHWSIVLGRGDFFFCLLSFVLSVKSPLRDAEVSF